MSHIMSRYNSVECVQILLLEDQVKTTPLFAERVKDYSGIKALLARHPCLHVFSLNHDVNMEEICKCHGVPYRDGFYDDPAKRYANIAVFKTLRLWASVRSTRYILLARRAPVPRCS